MKFDLDAVSASSDFKYLFTDFKIYICFYLDLDVFRIFYYNGESSFETCLYENICHFKFIYY
jgi:hypothetical protein